MVVDAFYLVVVVVVVVVEGMRRHAVAAQLCTGFTGPTAAAPS